MFVFHEVHCDDLRMEREGVSFGAYVATRTLMEDLVAAAESRNVPLALRFRHPFAQAALRYDPADHAIRRWAERGHEIGVHGHRRHLRRTRDLLWQAGLRPRAVVPGLIRTDDATTRRTLAATRHLGFQWCTDQVQGRAFPYSGLVPWRPLPDLSGPAPRTLPWAAAPLVLLDVSVNPFTWGILEPGVAGHPDGVRQVCGLGWEQLGRLLERLDAHRRPPSPHPVTFFGYPFHEHQHARSVDDLRTVPSSLDAWTAFLDAVAARGLPSVAPGFIARAWLEAEAIAPDDPDGAPLTARVAQALDPQDLRLDGPSWLRDHLPLEPLRAAALGLAAGAEAARAALRTRRRAWRSRASRWGDRVEVAVAGRTLDALRVDAAGPTRAVLCVSVAGTDGGLTTGLEPWGLVPGDLAAHGLELWLYDRSGTGRTRGALPVVPGSPGHADDAVAVWQAATGGRPLRAGWLTWSGGVIGPCMGLERMAGVDFVIDAEGPSDRLSLRPALRLRHRAAVRAAELGLGQDVAEGPHEAFRHVARVPVWHRLQGDPDHQHGHCLLHAGVVLEAAAAAGAEAWLNGAPWEEARWLAGPIRQHPEATLAAVVEEATRSR